MVEYRGALEPLTILRERIVVSGGEPVEIDVRISRHGPLVSDAINTNNAAANDDPKPEPIEPLAFRWTALDESDDSHARSTDEHEGRRLSAARAPPGRGGAGRAFFAPVLCDSVLELDAKTAS